MATSANPYRGCRFPAEPIEHAIRPVLTWSEARLGGVRIVCIMDRGHAASLRVADKLGFEIYARTTYKGAATLILQRPGSGRQQAVK